MPDTRQANQNAFRRLKAEIDARFPHGHWIAIDEARIIADAPEFDELTAALEDLGKDSSNVLLAQAGVDYPEYVTILTSDSPQ